MTADPLITEAREQADFMQRCSDEGRRPAQLAMRDVALILTRLADALVVERQRLQTLEAALDAEIARMDDIYQSHMNANDYPRIIAAGAYLDGIKFARAALRKEGTPQ